MEQTRTQFEEKARLERNKPEMTQDELSLEKKRRNFFHGLTNRFMALAMAGLITLGGDIGKSYAEQLRVAKNEKGLPEFVLETAITDEKLAEFEEQLRQEEPEFLDWLKNYEMDLTAQLYKLPENIFANLESRKMDKSQELGLFAAAEEKFGSPISERMHQNLRALINDSHLIRKQMNKEQELIRSACQLLADNIHVVMLSSVFMENSKDVREEMIKSHNPPLISFALHDSLELLVEGVAFTIPIRREIAEKARVEKTGIKLPDKWQPEILLTPWAFGRKPEQKIDIDCFLGVLIHELGHSIRQGPIESHSLRHSNLFRMLNEGIVENYTSETVKLLGRKDDRFRSMIGYEPSFDYDHRLVLAVILKSMAELGKETDLLSKWHMQLISDDVFLKKLGDHIKSIRINDKVIEDIRQFEMNSEEKETFSSQGVIYEVSPSARLLYAILARLNMSQVELSPEFIKKIMLNGLVDDWQVDNVESLIKVLPDFIEQKLTRLQK